MPEKRITVGIIRKPHGIHGEASVEAWTASPERFTELKDVTLVSPDEARSRLARIETVRLHGDRALVKLAGVETPEDMKTIQGWTIEIPAAQARKLDAGEYFLHDLAGLTLVDRDGKSRGVVQEAYEGGGGILLSVDGPHGEYEVPFATEICTQIDLEGKRIIVDLPAGLDDLGNVAR